MDEVELDKYELRLQEQMEKLKQCQEEKGFDSCFNCDDLLLCKIRSDYVKAVYQSMNKGQDGGFEF